MNRLTTILITLLAFLVSPMASYAQYERSMDHSISVAEVNDYVNNYKSSIPDGSAGILGFQFSNETIEQVLNQDGVEGIEFSWAVVLRDIPDPMCDDYTITDPIAVNRAVFNMVVYATDEYGNKLTGVVGIHHSRVYATNDGGVYTDSVDYSMSDDALGWRDLPESYLDLMIHSSMDLSQQISGEVISNNFWFGRDAIDDLLSQSGVDGIAFIQGATQQGGGKPVGNLFPIGTTGEIDMSGTIAQPCERSMPCPPFCPGVYEAYSRSEGYRLVWIKVEAGWEWRWYSAQGRLVDTGLIRDVKFPELWRRIQAWLGLL